MQIDLTAAIAVVASIAAIVFGFLAVRERFGTKEKTSGQESGQLISDMGYVKGGIDDIKRKQEKQDDKFVDVVAKIACNEGSIKSAHRRIDIIEIDCKKFTQKD